MVRRPTAAPSPLPDPAPELAEAWALFERGNNRDARRVAERLQQDPTSSPKVQAEAADLLRRIGYDPVALAAVGGIAGTILLIVILLILSRRFNG